MTQTEIEAYCLSKSGAFTDTPFGSDVTVVKVKSTNSQSNGQWNDELTYPLPKEDAAAQSEQQTPPDYPHVTESRADASPPAPTENRAAEPGQSVPTESAEKRNDTLLRAKEAINANSKRVDGHWIWFL